jgi:hypothetical protein
MGHVLTQKQKGYASLRSQHFLTRNRQADDEVPQPEQLDQDLFDERPPEQPSPEQLNLYFDPTSFQQQQDPEEMCPEFEEDEQ